MVAASSHRGSRIWYYYPVKNAIRMQRTITSQLKEHIGNEVLLKGWLYNLRLLGKVNFLILRDRGGLAQTVISDTKELEKVKDLQPGSVLQIEGRAVNADTDAGVEVTNATVTVLQAITEVPPIDITKAEIKADLETIIENRAVALRNQKHAALFKVQAEILEAFRKSMQSLEFTEFKSPILLGSPSESGADVFETKYFEGKAFLAQSPQLYKQIMLVAFERVFTVGPVFRAEKHNTSRHLMEFTQMDGEMAFIESYNDALEVIEKVVRDILIHLEKNVSNELNLWKIALPKLPTNSFPQLKVKDALVLIEKRTGKSAKRDELDVDPEDERELGKWAQEEHNSDFMFLLNYKKNKNFYTGNNPDDPEESLSYDLLFRGLELLSGTHRINDYDELIKRMKAEELNLDTFHHYLQAFKYGMPSEAGFSFGLERFTQRIFGLDNIRETTLFPTDLKRIAGQHRVVEKIKDGAHMVEKIKQILKDMNIDYDYAEHEPTATSDDAAKLRMTKPEEGVKALILKGKKSHKNIQVNIPGNMKVDMKAVAAELGERFEFETPEAILEKYGLQVGGIPPFGNLLGIETYFDERITKEEKSAFNAGTKTQSITTKSTDLVRAVSPKLGRYAV